VSDLQEQVNICALMTAGRYENTWCRNNMEHSFRKLGIPLIVSGGVYYGQCMQIMMEDAIKAGVEYILTVDGDSVFTAEQLQRLISIAVQEKESIDALCAMQVRRGKKSILGTLEGHTSATWNGYPLRLDTAHFGLTIINAKKLAEVPKPWFFCQPSSTGGWDDDKIDSDVWFWCQWKKAGRTLYMDPGCRIGHLEEMVAIHEEDMSITHMYPAEWVERIQRQNANDKTAEALEAVSDRAGSDVE
jgi:hypothetical protein